MNMIAFIETRNILKLRITINNLAAAGVAPYFKHNTGIFAIFLVYAGNILLLKNELFTFRASCCPHTKIVQFLAGSISTRPWDHDFNTD
jgi:hypothetical protein